MRSLAAILTAFAAAAVLSSPASAAEAPGGLPIAFGGPFALTDHHGVPHTDHDFRGKFMLVFFGYTNCPVICPTGLQTISQALDRLGPMARRVQPVFVTVDPERDRPAVLARFVANFHPSLIGLTGTERQIRAVASAYRVHRYKVTVGEKKSARDYLAAHSSLTYLMGPDGAWRTIFPHDTRVGAMVRALGRHLSEQDCDGDRPC